MKKIFVLVLSFIVSNVLALTNSQPELNELYQSVIFIKSDAPDQNGDTAPGFCNATLISSHMAITAAHCVYLNYISHDYNIEIEKGAYKYKVLPDGQKRRIGYAPTFSTNLNITIEFPQKLKAKFDRSGYKSKIGPDEDMAIIYWKENLVELELNQYAEILPPSEFEIVKNQLTSFSPKVVSINPFTEMSLDTKRFAFLNDLKNTFSGYLESKSLSRVQEGDSGSPLFITKNGKESLLAVVKGRGETVFSNWDAYAPVSKYSCEINLRLPTELKMKHCK